MANRHKARESILEILYAWQSAEQDSMMLPSLLTDRLNMPERQDQDQAYVRDAIAQLIADIAHIDEHIAASVKGRSLRSIGPLEISILRLAAWELMQRLEIPYRVVINEALELTSTYGDTSVRGFVNGVLDALAKQLRGKEKNA